MDSSGAIDDDPDIEIFCDPPLAERCTRFALSQSAETLNNEAKIETPKLFTIVVPDAASSLQTAQGIPRVIVGKIICLLVEIARQEASREAQVKLDDRRAFDMAKQEASSEVSASSPMSKPGANIRFLSLSK